MSDLDDILSAAQGGRLVANLSQRFGLSEEQIEGAIRALAPALAIGLNHAAEQPNAFGKMVGALALSDQSSAYDEPDAAYSDDSVARGRDALTDLFGSPAAAGQIVQAAARESGVRPDILSQLLPILASVLISGLTKSINSQGLGGILGQLANSGALGDILGQVLGGGRAPQQGSTSRGGGGLGDVLGQVLGGGQAPQPAPAPMPRGGGGLGGLLGGLLGALLGGRRAPPGVDPRGGGFDRGGAGGSFDRGGPLDADVGPVGTGPAGLPPGIDEASLQQAIEQIKKTLQVGQKGAAPPSASGGQSDLENLLGHLLGKRQG